MAGEGCAQASCAFPTIADQQIAHAVLEQSPRPPPAAPGGQPAGSSCGRTGSRQTGPGGTAVVGLALKKDKRKKHISDKLVQQAAEVGITLKFIDKEVPLDEQGPFVAILQKVRKPEWEAALEEYAAAHPEVRVYDLPAATYPLRNRGTMFSFMDGDGWVFEEPPELVEGGRSPQRCRCTVPTNTTLAAGCSYEQAGEQLDQAGLQYPLLAKPLWADGREGSHALAVVHTPGGLQRLLAGEAAHLQLPVLLQQYVDHGGCLFKVYVLGDVSVRVKRNSLHLPQWCCAPARAAPAAAAGGDASVQQPQQQPDKYAVVATAGAGDGAVASNGSSGGAGRRRLLDLELMERVSAYPASKSWGKADTAPKGHGVPSPPAWLLQALAQRLRQKTGLNLFNFDVIVPMHCHRRRMPHDTSAANLTTPGRRSESGGGGLQAAGTEEHPQQQASRAEEAPAAMAATGLVDAADEPAVLDLQAAQAAAAAAAAAASQQQDPAADDVGQSQGQQQDGRVQQQQQQQQQGGGHQEQQEDQEELLYHLIDINYFPGYEKMPNYEEYMVQFLSSVALPQPRQQPPDD